MTPHVLSLVDAGDVELFERIHTTVSMLPDLDLGVDEAGKPIPLSCHVLVRAFLRLQPTVTYRDGYFARCWEHSWLLTAHGNLIDVYPVATYGGPALINGRFVRPAGGLYRPTTQHEYHADGLARGRFAVQWSECAVRCRA